MLRRPKRGTLQTGAMERGARSACRVRLPCSSFYRRFPRPPPEIALVSRPFASDADSLLPSPPPTFTFSRVSSSSSSPSSSSSSLLHESEVNRAWPSRPIAAPLCSPSRSSVSPAPSPLPGPLLVSLFRRGLSSRGSSARVWLVRVWVGFVVVVVDDRVELWWSLITVREACVLWRLGDVNEFLMFVGIPKQPDGLEFGRSCESSVAVDEMVRGLRNFPFSVWFSTAVSSCWEILLLGPGSKGKVFNLS